MKIIDLTKDYSDLNLQQIRKELAKRSIDILEQHFRHFTLIIKI